MCSVCVRACVRACLRACVQRVCVCVCVCVCVLTYTSTELHSFTGKFDDFDLHLYVNFTLLQIGLMSLTYLRDHGKIRTILK